jgi:ribosomal protein S18 acetylase RimI-like enzyme
MIRPARPDDEDAIAELSLEAWEPVFASMAEVVGPEIFAAIFPPDWRTYQEKDVRRACQTYRVSVADVHGEVVGFTAVDLPDGEDHGEIYMLAVRPGHQGKGIGSALTEAAMEQMRAAGRRLAIVGTGGDAGHAPARATYERAGFTYLPQRQYFRLLDDSR